MWGYGARRSARLSEGEKRGCAALCDVDESQIAKAAKEILEPALAAAPSLKTFDFRKVLDMKELEAVIVATPDHWHALPAVMACQAGKDVYVEKPLSVSIGEGRVMVAVARKHDRVVQMGTPATQRAHCHRSR